MACESNSCSELLAPGWTKSTFGGKVLVSLFSSLFEICFDDHIFLVLDSTFGNYLSCNIAVGLAQLLLMCQYQSEVLKGPFQSVFKYLILATNRTFPKRQLSIKDFA